jgi:hypothetical protein
LASEIDKFLEDNGVDTQEFDQLKNQVLDTFQLAQKENTKLNNRKDFYKYMAQKNTDQLNQP